MKIYSQCYFRRKQREMPVPNCFSFAVVFAMISMCLIVVMPPIITGVKVEMPQLNTQPIEIFDDFTYVTVYITEEGRIMVNGAQTSMDDVADAVKIIYKDVPMKDIKIFVRSDKNINYNSIIALLQVLNDNGFTDITLVGQYTGGIQNLY